MRLLVVGAGATGGYVGGRLAEKGRDVTFLVRPGRAAQLRNQGLRITSPHGDLTLQPKVLTAGEIAAPFDAVLLSVKGFQLESAMADIAPAVGKETMILPVLNGMTHMDTLSRRFRPHTVPGCVLKIMTVLEDDGRIVQLTPMIDLAYGERDGSTSARMRALDEFMQGADVGARLSAAIEREMWEKWVLLASLGAITCLMRGTIGEIEAVPFGAAFALQVLDEVVAVVTKEGVPPSDAFLRATREQITAKGSTAAPSMYRDLVRGRPVEVENIIGDLVRLGMQAGIAAPLLAAAYAHLSLYQKRVSQ